MMALTLTLGDVLAIILCVISCLCILIVQRVYLHPLRGYPGPKLAAITSFYRAYYDVVRGAVFVYQLEKLHQEYGPVVRTGPNELHFSTPRAFSNIYAQGSQFAKDPVIYRSFEVDGSVLMMHDPHEAKKRRDMLAPFFSRRAILSLEGTIQSRVDKLVAKLKTYGNRPANLSFAVRATTMDIITSYCFASSFEAIEAPEFRHPILMGQNASLHWLWVIKYLPFLPSLVAGLPAWIAKHLPLYEEFVAVRHSLSKQVDAFLENEALLNNVEHEIIYHHLIRPRSDKNFERVSRNDLVSESLTMLGAGSDTVGTSCTYGIFKALSDKRILLELQKELKKAWPDIDGPMGYTSLEKLPYLTAFVKETLRVAYGVITPIPKIVRPGHAVIDGHFVPAGTSVAMGVSFLHDDPKVFPEPHRFLPERWLVDGARDLEPFFAPFSKGPRMCPGMNLGWCEMYLILGHLFRKLDMEIYETTIEDFKFKELFTPVPSGRPFQVIAAERLD